MNRTEIRNLVITVVVLLALALLPLSENSDWLMLLAVPIAMYTVLATSWALFSGPTHYISLATAAFFGVGSYTVGAGIDFVSYWILLPLAGLFGALLALLVGLATLRLSGVYFVIFTLGLSIDSPGGHLGSVANRQSRHVCVNRSDRNTYLLAVAVPGRTGVSDRMAGQPVTVGLCTANNRQ